MRDKNILSKLMSIVLVCCIILNITTDAIGAELSSKDYFDLATEVYDKKWTTPSGYTEYKKTVIKYLTDALRQDDEWIKDNRSQVHYLLGRVHFCGNEANKEYTISLSYNDKWLSTHSSRVHFARGVSKYQCSEDSVENRNEITNDYLSALSNPLALDDINPSEIYYGLAIAQGKPSQATIDYYTTALGMNDKWINDHRSIVYHSRGADYLELGENDKATKDLTAALNQDDEFTDDAGLYVIYEALGDAFFSSRNFEAAVKNYDAAFEHGEGWSHVSNCYHSKVYFKRGSAYEQLKNFDKAIENYNVALKQNDEWIKSDDNRAIVSKACQNLVKKEL